jgi:hypothetical protein
VEDRDEKTGSDPEIEAHRRRMAKANEEPSSEESDESVEAEDDVELHRKRLK